MADEVLVRECLSDRHIRSGKKVISLLDDAKIPLAAAYWICTYDRGYWRLAIVTPLVEQIGLIETLKRISPLVRSARLSASVSIDSGWFPVGVKYREFETMLKYIRTSRPLIDTESTRSVVGDSMVDLFFYRFPATYSYESNKQLARPRYAYVW